jgi:putative oxidoreductase
MRVGRMMGTKRLNMRWYSAMNQLIVSGADGDPMSLLNVMRNERNSTQKLLAPSPPRAVVLVRLAIAFVFVTEGLQKFLDPDALGVGRFTKIGIPYADITAPAVGAIEIACGALILIGLFTRLAAFALLIDMVVAIVSTKVPILLGYSFAGFAAPVGETGFWSMAHESRTDVVMLLGCLFLVVVGPGTVSIDGRMTRRSL